MILGMLVSLVSKNILQGDFQVKLRVLLFIVCVVVMAGDASGVIVEIQLQSQASTGSQRANLNVEGGVLQPFTAAFGHSNGFSQFTPSPSHTIYMDPLFLSLDAATPLADLTPAAFTVSNFIGSWTANITTNGLRDAVVGSFDIPLTITGVGATETSFEMSFVGDGAMLADTTIQGQAFQIPFEGASVATVNASAIPEPSQWIAFVLLTIGVAWRRLRR